MNARRPRHAKTPPPGTVIITSGYLQRYTVFAQSLINLLRPPGTKIGWAMGVNIAGNLNHMVEKAQGEWVWFMGDDHVFAPDVLLRLLAHEVDIVAPLVVMRQAPYAPIVFTQDNPDGSFKFWPGKDLPPGGLHEVAAASGAGMLVRRHVLETLNPPWFEIGQIQSSEMSEDVYFYRKARQKGFKCYVDFDTRLGHITPSALWAEPDQQGHWSIRVDPDCVIPEVQA